MKRALITGAASGLGAALSARLSAEGFDVVSLDRSPPAADAGVTAIQCDLSDRDAVDRTLPVILAAGPYDIAVFNAGVNATGRFEEMPLAAYRGLMTVNAETPMVIAAALMREKAVKKNMCFIASLSHFTGYPGAAVYAASKDALAVYAKSVRKPFGRRGVTVTLACPGPLRTGHAERHGPDGADPEKRLEPDEAARAILKAIFAGRRLVIPGRDAKLAALAGRLFRERATRTMRRLIFDRLKGPVW